MNINIKEFENKFEENYEMLYQNDILCQNDNTIKDYDKKIDEFDELVKKDNVKELLKQFIIHRGDFISSDRECIAFVLTLESYM